MTIQYLKHKDQRYYLTLNNTVGTSDAISIPANYNIMTLMLSNISSGTCQIMFSLSQQENVENNSAWWHSWSLGAVSTNVGQTFDSPITYMYVKTSSSNTRYNLELLI